MLVLITYDVNTETNAGKTRLRKVAKQCTNYGRRVQNSVFECIVDNVQCVELKAILSDIIDKNLDSLRFYYLGNNYQTKIEHIGIERGISADQVLFLYWESAVEIEAAMIAASSSPQIPAGKNLRAIAVKTSF